MSRIIDEIEIFNETQDGLITNGKAIDSTIPTTAGRFAPGCVLLGVDGKSYKNTGTTASPSWDSVDSISTSEIASGAVTLAKLASGISASHILKFFKLGSTITTTALVGVAVNDLVVTIVADGTVTVGTVAVADTLPADPADTSYVLVFRAVA
jgi:hypothetical protein